MGQLYYEGFCTNISGTFGLFWNLERCQKIFVRLISRVQSCSRKVRNSNLSNIEIFTITLLRNIVNKEQITATLGLHNGTVSFTHIEIEATCVQNSRIDYLL